MAYELISFPNDAALAQEVAKKWLEELSGRDLSVNYCVALSGGRISKTFFQEIVSQNKTKQTSFAGVHFFWADERCVSPDDPESNYAVAKALLLDPLGVPERQIHRLKGEQIESLALSDAVSNICNETKRDATGKPVLDMVFLGMGEDGHVASLFPGEAENVIEGDDLFRAVTAVKPPPRRITMGYGVLAAAKKVWVLVSGKGKERALAESLSPNGQTPMARVLRMRKETVIYSDIGTVG